MRLKPSTSVGGDIGRNTMIQNFNGVLEEVERGIGNQEEATLSPNLSFHVFSHGF
jgi:hypothetical protein